jgi:6-O-methylguanine DNA methyltransferase, DNA binding domain
VGRYPLCIFLACHRVVAGPGKLTGYAGGLARKRGLVDLEQTTPPRLLSPMVITGAAGLGHRTAASECVVRASGRGGRVGAFGTDRTAASAGACGRERGGDVLE